MILHATAAVFLVTAAMWIGLDAYARYVGYTNLILWKDAVLTQCSQMQPHPRFSAERRYKSGHVVRDLLPRP